MKNLILAFTLILIAIKVEAQYFDVPLKDADNLWQSGKIEDAIEMYKLIIKGYEIPRAYESLVSIRLAEAQYQTKQYDDCLQTLANMSVIEKIPEHHALKMMDIKKAINNEPLYSRTAIPSRDKIAVSCFVSQKSGNYKADGTVQKPFSSIEQALEFVKKILNGSTIKRGTAEIVLLDNEYKISREIKIDLSGTEKNPVVIRSQSESNRTLINGGVPVLNWEKETDREMLSLLPSNVRGKVLVADFDKNEISGLPEYILTGSSSKRNRGNDAYVPELFCNDTPQILSKWPNDRSIYSTMEGFKDSRADKWVQENDVWLHGYWKHTWSDAYEKLKSFSESTGIELEEPFNGYGFANEASSKGWWIPTKSDWYVVNSLSEIDIPGEYKISVEDKKIWYFPNEDFDPGHCFLSLNGNVFLMEGVNHLTIEGLDFRYIRGNVLTATDCSDISFINNSVKNSSSYAIEINGGKNYLIHSNTIENMGKGGININGIGNIERLEDANSVIENCTFRNLSRLDKTYTPALKLGGVGILVQNCLFDNMQSSAIRIEGNDILVQLNRFANCVLDSDDQGTIESFGNPLFRGNVIRWNYFYKEGVKPQVGPIRLDDLISGYCITENIFRQSGMNWFGGVQIHGGHYNIIEGNLHVDCNSLVSQTAYGNESWFSSLNKSEALNGEYWKNDLWQNRYPDLKLLFDENDYDLNYSIDNLGVNTTQKFLRKTDQLKSLNDLLIEETDVPEELSDLKKYMMPWHKIPVSKIGLY